MRMQRDERQHERRETTRERGAAFCAGARELSSWSRCLCWRPGRGYGARKRVLGRWPDGGLHAAPWSLVLSAGADRARYVMPETGPTAHSFPGLSFLQRPRRAADRGDDRLASGPSCGQAHGMAPGPLTNLGLLALLDRTIEIKVEWLELDRKSTSDYRNAS